MRLAPIITLCILGVIFKDVIALPCLSTVTKTKFEATRKVLTDLGKNIKNKIKKLDDDMESLVTDFKKKQWYKHNGHCYYFGSEKLSWFKSEQQCKQIGGHLAKIEDSTENKWIFDKRPKKDHYWMGLTDLKEGEYRWSYDQTIASFTAWHNGWGTKGTSHNCGLMYHTTYTWLDYPCATEYYYVCESHFCY
ncbi:perlucin-like protein [Mytilus galloprovincialis]|uniref:perlucin-like protein n=1 Tax=Mytilus galloprovincialis TaxID=29158 RepID=UPI003F7C6E26